MWAVYRLIVAMLNFLAGGMAVGMYLRGGSGGYLALALVCFFFAPLMLRLFVRDDGQISAWVFILAGLGAVNMMFAAVNIGQFAAIGASALTLVVGLINLAVALFCNHQVVKHE